MDNTPGSTEAPPEQTGGPPPRPRLERRQDGKVIAGVASGLGAYTGVDPVAFRIIFVVLALFGAMGILLYLLAWALIPAQGEATAPAFRKGGVTRWLALGAIALGVVVFASNFGFNGNILFGGALIVVGVLLLRDEPVGGPTYAPPPQPPPPPPQTGEVRPPPPPPAPPRPPRPRSSLTLLTLAAALIFIGVVAALDNMGLISAEVGSFPALVMAVVGTGLIVGTMWGRGRVLILVGLLAIPPVMLASFVDHDLSGEVGERWVIPSSPDELSERYDFLMGHLTLDLTRLEPGFGTETTTVELGAAALDIYAPPWMTLQAAGRIALGEVNFEGFSRDGDDLNFSRTLPGEAGEGTVRVLVDGGIGVVSVYHRSPEEFRIPNVPKVPKVPELDERLRGDN